MISVIVVAIVLGLAATCVVLLIKNSSLRYKNDCALAEAENWKRDNAALKKERQLLEEDVNRLEAQLQNAFGTIKSNGDLIQELTEKLDSHIKPWTPSEEQVAAPESVVKTSSKAKKPKAGSKPIKPRAKKSKK